MWKFELVYHHDIEVSSFRLLKKLNYNKHHHYNFVAYNFLDRENGGDSVETGARSRSFGYITKKEAEPRPVTKFAAFCFQKS